jgi:hypothetical protein
MYAASFCRRTNRAIAITRDDRRDGMRGVRGWPPGRTWLGMVTLRAVRRPTPCGTGRPAALRASLTAFSLVKGSVATRGNPVVGAVAVIL